MIRAALLLLALAGCGGGDAVDCRVKPVGADALEQAQWVQICET